MDYLSHVVLKAEVLDFDDREDFGEDISGHAVSAARTGMLAYYAKKSAPFGSLKKKIIDNDEAVVFFSNSKKIMISLLKTWQDKSGEKAYIAAKQHLAIMHGSYDEGKKQTAIGNLIAGKPATWSSNLKRSLDLYKAKKIGYTTPHWLSEDKSKYSMEMAKREADIYNMSHHFYYCYVGAPHHNKANLEMTVLMQNAVTPQIVATWLEKHAG